MINELRTRLGRELERHSQELEQRVAARLRESVAGAGAPDVNNDDELTEKIRFLGQLVAGLPTLPPNCIFDDRAGYGSFVRVRDVQTGALEQYTLMTGDFMDLEEGQVSLASPIGRELLGRRPGDISEVQMPRGHRRFEVLEVRTLAEYLGHAADVDSPSKPSAVQLA